MKKLLLLLNILIISQVSFSQANLNKGDSLRQEGNLEAAIAAYKITYINTPDNWKNTYNLACAYALTYQKDSAYHFLTIALKSDYSLWALADTDLFALTDDPRWSAIENSQIKRFQEKNKNTLKQPEYTKKLLHLIMKDQVLDYYIDQAKNYYRKMGAIPQWYYPLGAYKKQIGVENYETMQQLLKNYGWPKYSTVGKLAADAPLLIINHSEDDNVRKKYIVQIKQACLDKEGSCEEYAKIQDRILVNDNKPQMYGMQFRYTPERNLEPFPIKDPEYVDQRRKKIDLGPLKDYLKRKINYDWIIVQKIE